MTQDQVILWLKVAAATVVGFGLMMTAAAVPSLMQPTALLLDLVFFPLDHSPTMSEPVVRLLSAICGGVLVGWGVSLWQIVTRLLPRDPSLARQLILTGVSSWFVIDSCGSIASGGHWNVLGNIGFLLIFVIPVLQLPKRQAG